MKINNINESIKYVVCLILMCFLVLGNPGNISKSILMNVRNEVIPFAGAENMNKNTLLEQAFPAYAAKEGYVPEYKENIDSYDTTVNTILSTPMDSDSDTKTASDEIEVTTQSDNSVMTASGSEETCNTDNNTVEAVSISSDSSNFNVGIDYSMEQLADFEFLISNCYTVDGSTSITAKDLNIDAMVNEDLTIDLSGDEYKILIYHTHGSETFIDSSPGVMEDTIIGVGDELTRILEEDYGIKTYHDRTVYDVVDGKLDRNYAYTQSGYGIDKILEQYPSIEVVLDIHRDGVRDEVHLMKVIDGKATAQIMFFNGVSRLNEEGDLGYLNNTNLSSNLSFSLQMHLIGKNMYGDLMRKIYVGGYCYNLDRKPRASLIEVGAQTNTVEEAKNAMIPLAAILYRVLSGS